MSVGGRRLRRLNNSASLFDAILISWQFAMTGNGLKWDKGSAGV